MRGRWNRIPPPENRYVVTETGCWEWTGGRTYHGYARVYPDGRSKPSISAHVWFYERLVGKVPPGMELDHLCRNRICVNPAHMEVVTHKVNTLRGNNPCAINARATVCSRGHEFADHTYIEPKTGYRYCRVCMTIRQREYRARKKAKPCSRPDGHTRTCGSTRPLVRVWGKT